MFILRISHTTYILKVLFLKNEYVLTMRAFNHIYILGGEAGVQVAEARLPRYETAYSGDGENCEKDSNPEPLRGSRPDRDLSRHQDNPHDGQALGVVLGVDFDALAQLRELTSSR